MSVPVELALCATIGGIPASSIGAITSRVSFALLEKPRSKLNSVRAEETHRKLQPMRRL
jgi:hypothetical protein